MSIPFKQWLLREYRHPSLVNHPSYKLALDIEAKWPDFPEEPNEYSYLSQWLSMHGACATCKSAFKDAWDNYVGDEPLACL